MEIKHTPNPDHDSCSCGCSAYEPCHKKGCPHCDLPQNDHFRLEE